MGGEVQLLGPGAPLGPHTGVHTLRQLRSETLRKRPATAPDLCALTWLRSSTENTELAKSELGRMRVSTDTVVVWAMARLGRAGSETAGLPATRHFARVCGALGQNYAQERRAGYPASVLLQISGCQSPAF